MHNGRLEDTEELDSEGLQGKKQEEIGSWKAGTRIWTDNLGNLGLIQPGNARSLLSM